MQHIKFNTDPAVMKETVESEISRQKLEKFLPTLMYKVRFMIINSVQSEHENSGIGRRLKLWL